MTYDDVINHFGNWSKASRMLEMGSSTNRSWIRCGFIPIETQIRIEIMMDGDLKANLDDCAQQFQQFRDARESIRSGR